MSTILQRLSAKTVFFYESRHHRLSDWRALFGAYVGGSFLFGNVGQLVAGPGNAGLT